MAISALRRLTEVLRRQKTGIGIESPRALGDGHQHHAAIDEVIPILGSASLGGLVEGAVVDLSDEMGVVEGRRT